MISEGQDTWEDAVAGGRGSELGVFLTDSEEDADGVGEEREINQEEMFVKCRCLPKIVSISQAIVYFLLSYQLIEKQVNNNKEDPNST